MEPFSSSFFHHTNQFKPKCYHLTLYRSTHISPARVCIPEIPSHRHHRTLNKYDAESTQSRFFKQMFCSLCNETVMTQYNLKSCLSSTSSMLPWWRIKMKMFWSEALNSSLSLSNIVVGSCDFSSFVTFSFRGYINQPWPVGPNRWLW